MTKVNLIQSLESTQIIPDVIEQSTELATFLNVSYTSELENNTFGKEISPKEAQSIPLVDFEVEDKSAYYTLVMTDPDAPSFFDRKFGPWRHWIVTNISGSNIQNDLSNLENHHTPYIGPGPGPNTGTHRYTFLLYKQNNGKQEFRAMEHQEREHRRYFKVRDFEKENNLGLVAINYFNCPT